MRLQYSEMPLSGITEFRYPDDSYRRIIYSVRRHLPQYLMLLELLLSPPLFFVSQKHNCQLL